MRKKLNIFVNLAALIAFLLSLTLRIILWLTFPEGTTFQHWSEVQKVTSYYGIKLIGEPVEDIKQKMEPSSLRQSDDLRLQTAGLEIQGRLQGKGFPSRFRVITSASVVTTGIRQVCRII